VTQRRALPRDCSKCQQKTEHTREEEIGGSLSIRCAVCKTETKRVTLRESLENLYEALFEGED